MYLGNDLLGPVEELPPLPLLEDPILHLPQVLGMVPVFTNNHLDTWVLFYSRRSSGQMYKYLVSNSRRIYHFCVWQFMKVARF